MAILRSNGILITDSAPVHVPVDNEATLAFDEVNGVLYNYDAGWQVLNGTVGTGLTALEAYNTNGILTQTAEDTFVGRSIGGTANEISVANADGVAGNPTISLPAEINLGGKTSLEIPNSAAPTLDADGEIALDTTVADFSHSILKLFGGEEQFAVTLPITELTSPQNGDVPMYNSTDDEFQLVQTVLPIYTYEVVIAQTGAGNPTGTPSANNLGEVPTFNRVVEGSYEIGTAGTPFTVGKTIVQATLGVDATAATVKAGWSATNKVVFQTFDNTNTLDELEGSVTITVKVYA